MSSTVTFHLSQSIDDRGRVSSKVYGGTVFLQIDTTDEDYEKVWKWMIEPDQTQDCKVEFKSIGDVETTMKTIEMKEAYCVQYSEGFSETGSNPLSLSITVSAKELIINNIPHRNYA